MAATVSGRSLQSEQAKKKIRSASGALLAVAIIQFFCAIILFMVLQSSLSVIEGANPKLAMLIPAVVAGIGFIYIGLWVWAKTSPYPASLVGLVLYGTLWLVDAASDPANMHRGLIIKVIIIAVLIKAVKAGAEYRRLQNVHGVGR